MEIDDERQLLARTGVAAAGDRAVARIDRLVGDGGDLSARIGQRAARRLEDRADLRDRQRVAVGLGRLQGGGAGEGVPHLGVERAHAGSARARRRCDSATSTTTSADTMIADSENQLVRNTIMEPCE